MLVRINLPCIAVTAISGPAARVACFSACEPIFAAPRFIAESSKRYAGGTGLWRRPVIWWPLAGGGHAGTYSVQLTEYAGGPEERNEISIV